MAYKNRLKLLLKTTQQQALLKGLPQESVRLLKPGQTRAIVARTGSSQYRRLSPPLVDTGGFALIVKGVGLSFRLVPV